MREVNLAREPSQAKATNTLEVTRANTQDCFATRTEDEAPGTTGHGPPTYAHDPMVNVETRLIIDTLGKLATVALYRIISLFVLVHCARLLNSTSSRIVGGRSTIVQRESARICR